MQDKQAHKIYSTNFTADSADLIEVETIILNGLYRFSILGINQKSSSDTKDRVYSALRSQRLINLKSDNKKITVNLLPTSVEKRSNDYDLSIAIGCLVHMGQLELQDDILAIGELSITGNVLPSNRILKTIFQAIQARVRIIICSHDDMKTINSFRIDIHRIANKYNINLIAAKTLKELIHAVKHSEYSAVRQEKPECKPEGAYELEKNSKILMDKNIFKIVLALCTNRNIFIENKKSSYISKFLKNLIYYTVQLENEEILKIANSLDKTDEDILNKYCQPAISLIDSQTSKDELGSMLQESMFGFNIIDDLASIAEDAFSFIKKNKRSAVICFYKPCPCGNSNNLFTSFSSEKCICLQRSILRHRQKLMRLENNYFDFYVQNPENRYFEHEAQTYIYLNEMIRAFRNKIFTVDINDEMIGELLGGLPGHYDKPDLDTLIGVAKDIASLEFISGTTKKPILHKHHIDLAGEFVKKGF